MLVYIGCYFDLTDLNRPCNMNITTYLPTVLWCKLYLFFSAFIITEGYARLERFNGLSLACLRVVVTMPLIDQTSG